MLTAPIFSCKDSYELSSFSTKAKLLDGSAMRMKWCALVKTEIRLFKG